MAKDNITALTLVFKTNPMIQIDQFCANQLRGGQNCKYKINQSIKIINGVICNIQKTIKVF